VFVARLPSTARPPLPLTAAAACSKEAAAGDTAARRVSEQFPASMPGSGNAASLPLKS